MVKNSPASAGDIRDVDSIPRLGRSPGEGNGDPLQYSCHGRRSQQATVHGVTKSQTRLKRLSSQHIRASWGHEMHPIPNPYLTATDAPERKHLTKVHQIRLGTRAAHSSSASKDYVWLPLVARGVCACSQPFGVLSETAK